MRISNLYAIPWPAISADSYNFTFTARVAGNPYIFNFKYMNNKWRAFVTFPSGEVRRACMCPNVLQWSKYQDYSLLPVSTLETIGQNDLTQTTLYMIAWKP